MRVSFFGAKAIVLTTLCIFATALAPVVGIDQRNYLVIALISLLGPVIFIARIPVGRESLWVMATMLYMLLVTLIVGRTEDISTIGFTGLFFLAYIAFSSALITGRATLANVLFLLRTLIIAYGVVSVLQMVTSLVGIPVPNAILSKGLWSYNSLAVEPSHAGRSLAITMLAYLILSRTYFGSIGVMKLLRRERIPLMAFLVSILLTGSSLAVMAAPLAIILALPSRWIVWLSGILIAAWPFLYAIDLPVVQRALAFLNALPSMDVAAIANAEQSGALRVIPLLVYIDKIQIDQISSWLGGGLAQIEYYVKGELIGAGDLVSAGFIPGYLISFGIFGTALFVYSFLGRYLSRGTVPFVLLWIFLFSTTAWNTQLFWYGLMLYRLIHHFLVTEPARAIRAKRLIYRRSFLIRDSVHQAAT